MKPIRRLHRVAVLVGAGAVFLAACGDSADELLPTVGQTNQGDPAVAGACAPGEPDCDDTVVIGDEPGPLPSDDEPDAPDDASVSGGLLVGGGLSVSEALSTDATGVLAVSGFIVDDGIDARLCEALAESFPPQCAGASVPLVDYQQLDLGPLSEAGGTTWTDDSVVVFGELIDGKLVANPNVSG